MTLTKCLIAFDLKNKKNPHTAGHVTSMKFCIVMLLLITITAHVIQSQPHTLLHMTHQKSIVIVQTSLNSTHKGTLVSKFIQINPKLRFCGTCSLHLRWAAGTMRLSEAMFILRKGRVQGLEALETWWHGCCIVGFAFLLFKKEKKKWHVLFPFPFALWGNDFLSGLLVVA